MTPDNIEIGTLWMIVKGGLEAQLSPGSPRWRFYTKRHETTALLLETHTMPDGRHWVKVFCRNETVWFYQEHFLKCARRIS